MRHTTFVRSLAVCAALLAGTGLVACSDDGDSGSNNASSGQDGDSNSTADYCEVVRELFAVGQTIGTREPSDAEVDQMVDLLREASAAAPSQIRRDFSAAFVGDESAQESLSEYNQEQCGVDIATGTSTPG
jgi:hypothetical protein